MPHPSIRRALADNGQSVGSILAKRWTKFA